MNKIHTRRAGNTVRSKVRQTAATMKLILWFIYYLWYIYIYTHALLLEGHRVRLWRMWTEWGHMYLPVLVSIDSALIGPSAVPVGPPDHFDRNSWLSVLQVTSEKLQREATSFSMCSRPPALRSSATSPRDKDRLCPRSPTPSVSDHCVIMTHIIQIFLDVPL